jgi:hypothetical protein
MQSGYFFLIFHEILSDNMVSAYFLDLISTPQGWGSKLIVDDLTDFTKTDLKTLFLRVIHRE